MTEVVLKHVGKLFKSKKSGEDVAKEIAKEFLANPVSQTVTVKKLNG